MAQQKKVVWSERAQKEKLKILNFWIQQNKSTSYSEKLNSVIEETLELLKNHPEIGRKTDIGEDIRMKFIGDYEVFYQLEDFALLTSISTSLRCAQYDVSLSAMRRNDECSRRLLSGSAKRSIN